MRDHDALIAYLDAHLATPFVWGSHDCVTFAAGAVEAQTGRDPLASVTRWSSIREAFRVIKSYGGLAAAVDTVLSEIPPALAHRGDIGAVPYKNDVLLVVVEGLTVVGPSYEGLLRLPRAAMTRAWSAHA